MITERREHRDIKINGKPKVTNINAHRMASHLKINVAIQKRLYKASLHCEAEAHNSTHETIIHEEHARENEYELCPDLLKMKKQA